MRLPFQGFTRCRGGGLVFRGVIVPSPFTRGPRNRWAVAFSPNLLLPKGGHWLRAVKPKILQGFTRALTPMGSENRFRFLRADVYIYI